MLVQAEVSFPSPLIVPFRALFISDCARYRDQIVTPLGSIGCPDGDRLGIMVPRMSFPPNVAINGPFGSATLGAASRRFPGCVTWTCAACAHQEKKQEKMSVLPQVLVMVGDPDLRKLMRVLLRRQYALAEIPSVALAVESLRTSPDPLVVLWHFAWPSAIDQALLTRIDQEEVLQRHAFVLITSNLEGLPSEVRWLLARRQIPIIGLPFDLDVFLGQIAAAQERLAVRTTCGGLSAGD